MGEEKKKKSKKSSKDEKKKKSSKKSEKKDDKKEEKKVKKKKSSTKDNNNDKESKKKSKKKSRSSKSSSSKKKSEVIEIKEGVCVICKDESVETEAMGSHCKHTFCLGCLEHMLARPIPGEPKPEDNHLGAPTLGRCPVCNAEVHKFSVKEKVKGKPMYEKDFDIASSPLAGKVYVRKKTDSDRPPLGTFHFDSKELDSKGRMLPYMDFSEPIEHDTKEEIWILNNGEPVPDRKFFEPGCHYDAQTRTFHGSISWKPCRFQGSHRWDIILGFTKDLSALRVGLIHKRKERLGVVAASKDKHQLLYPLDGKWKLTWQDAEGEWQNGTVNVRNNEFRQGPYTFNLMLDDSETAGFRWPLDPIYASAKSGLDLDDKPKGPGIGKRIVWETTHPNFPEMKWHRETIGGEPIQATEHLGPDPYEYVEESALPKEAKDGDDSDDDDSEDGWDDSVSDSSYDSDDSDDSDSSSDDSDSD
mmetsp:Transcript_1089/g.2558  ORF Transcript_1089/g.2558 Transcript_1089/m.2558 type:complete len:472 (+) Transcript_1089:132-1547(+)